MRISAGGVTVSQERSKFNINQQAPIAAMR